MNTALMAIQSIAMDVRAVARVLGDAISIVMRQGGSIQSFMVLWSKNDKQKATIRIWMETGEVNIETVADWLRELEGVFEVRIL